MCFFRRKFCFANYLLKKSKMLCFLFFADRVKKW